MGGTTANGTWTCTDTIPQHAAGGTWVAERVEMRDSVGSWRYVYEEDLRAAGFAVAVTVMSP